MKHQMVHEVRGRGRRKVTNLFLRLFSCASCGSPGQGEPRQLGDAWVDEVDEVNEVYEIDEVDDGLSSMRR